MQIRDYRSLFITHAVLNRLQLAACVRGKEMTQQMFGYGAKQKWTQLGCRRRVTCRAQFPPTTAKRVHGPYVADTTDFAQALSLSTSHQATAFVPGQVAHLVADPEPDGPRRRPHRTERQQPIGGHSRCQYRGWRYVQSGGASNCLCKLLSVTGLDTAQKSVCRRYPGGGSPVPLYLELDETDIVNWVW